MAHSRREPVVEGIPIGEFEIHLKGPHIDCALPARFLHNYQRATSVWAEVVPTTPKWLFQQEVEVTSPSHLEPFRAVLGGLTGKQKDGSLTFSAEVVPLSFPVQSTVAKKLKEVSFALLDSPIAGNLVSEQHPKTVVLPCGQFDISIKSPTKTHLEIAHQLGSAPHRLTESGIITDRNGDLFTSNEAQTVLETLHAALSFAAGRWIGITMVQGNDTSATRTWFQWGTTRISGTENEPSWYDPRHPEWLRPLCDAILRLKAEEDRWEPVQTALYWYARSNTRDAGIDSSLILCQCALELLSWFVVVKEKGALSEEGYGQLGSASERLRLALTLLGIPRQIPVGLPGIAALRKEWRDIADAVVQARNYLVHPTQSRSGKRRAKREYPWYELWIAGQWLLELIILRILGYGGRYRNRTRWREFDQIERVPWA